MKKKILLPLLMLCIGCCAVATATGCEKEGQTDPPAKETLISKDSITLEFNQEYLLPLDYDGEETPVWTVEDATIVSVENGKLVALKAGTTTVTVKIGSHTDTISVTVSEMDMAKLSLEVVDANVTLYKNDEKQIVATGKYNGVVIDAAEKSYESTNADIVSVDANGKMTAKAYGNATITVCYKVYGTSLLSSVNVSVVSNGKVEIAQSSAELVYRGAPVTLTAKATEKGVENTSATIDWTATSGQDVITISENGTITAKNAGETDVTATYVDSEGQTQTDTITVTVLPIDVDTQKSIDASYDEKEHENGYSLDLENVIDDGVEIISAYTEKDGMRINIAYEEGKFDFSAISSGNTDLYVKTRNILYKVALSLAKTYYLDNNNFIDRMSEDLDSEKATYILEENIVLTDAWTNSAMFSGTLDGAGYSITGLSVDTQTGLFSVLKNATIKNVSVVNALLSGEETGVFAWKTEGTVMFDNVYVSLSADTVIGEYYATAQNDLVLTNQSQKAGLVSQSGTAAITVKNSVMYMPENMTKASGFVASWGSPTLTITGTTFIGGNGAVVGTCSGKTTNVTYTSGGNAYKAIDAVQAYKDLYGTAICGEAYASDKTAKIIKAIPKGATRTNANGWSAMIVAAYEANHPLRVWGKTNFVKNTLKKILTETSGDISVLKEDVTVSSNLSVGIISGVFDGQGHKISGIIGAKNAGGLFAGLRGSIKNASFAGDLNGVSAGLVANTVLYNAYLENVYAEVNFGDTITDGGYSQGGIFRVVGNASTNLSMKNVVVNVQGSAMPAASGAIVGYGSELKTVPTNAFGVYMDNCSYIAPSAQPMGSRGETISYFGKVTEADKYFFWDIDENHTTDDGLTYYATVAALKAGVSGLNTFMMNIINGLA